MVPDPSLWTAWRALFIQAFDALAGCVDPNSVASVGALCAAIDAFNDNAPRHIDTYFAPAQRISYHLGHPDIVALPCYPDLVKAHRAFNAEVGAYVAKFLSFPIRLDWDLTP